VEHLEQLIPEVAVVVAQVALLTLEAMEVLEL
jgi:hypothetical protein